MNKINEELKRISELSKFDFKYKSISNILNESDIDSVEQLDEFDRSAFQTIIKGDVKTVANSVKDLGMFKGSANAAEDFIRRAAAGRATVKEMGVFGKETLKMGSKLKTSQPGLFASASQSYAKNLFNNTTDNIANQFRNASTQDRIVLLKNAGYPEASINAIIKDYNVLSSASGGVKTGSKTTATNTKTGAKDAKTGAQDAKTGSKDIQSTENQLKSKVTEKPSAGTAADDLANDLKNVKNPKAKKSILSSINRLRKMGPKGWKRLARIKGKLRTYWLIKYGLIAGGAYLLYDSFFGGTTLPDDPRNEMFPKCVTDLLENDGSDWSVTTSGDPVIVATKTGNEEYDSKGGLKFFTNNRVFYGDNSKRGTWSCSGSDESKLTATPISEANPTGGRQQLYNDVETMIDLLDFPVSKQNMRDANALLDKYSSSGQGKQFLNLYQKSGYGGGSLSKTLNYIWTSQPETVELKSTMLDKITKMESGEASTSSNTTTSTGTAGGTKVGGISIVWDSSSSTSDKTGGGSTGGGGKKQSYKKCDSFPYSFGCISEDISYVQGCLNITPQKGYFGPKTKSTLESLGYDLSNGITQEIYKDVVTNKCGGGSNKPLKKPEPVKIEPIQRREPNLPTTLKPLERPSQFNPDITSNVSKTYSNLISNDKLIGRVDKGSKRIKLKDKDEAISTEEMKDLNDYLTSKGYKQMKTKDKGYGSKTVWVRK